MKSLLAIFIGFIMGTPSPNTPDKPAKVVIDQIEGNYAVVEFSKNETIKLIDIPAADINGEVFEGMKIPVIEVEGKFYGDMTYRDNQGVEDIYYQFKSDDDKVWWVLTATEIGHIPNINDKYTLFYTDNGTNEEISVCDCLPEWDCECYLYDDLFFHIERQI